MRSEPESRALRAELLQDPDEVAERFAALKVDGIDGFTVNAVANGHVEGRVTLLGETLRKVVGI